MMKRTLKMAKITPVLMYRSTLAAVALSTSFLVLGCGEALAPAVGLTIQGTRPSASLSALQLFPGFAVTSSSSTQIPVIGKGSSGQIGILTLTEARVVLKGIEIESDASTGTTVSSDDSSESEDDSSETETAFSGPYLVDLLTDTVSPSIDALDLPVGTFKAIKLTIHKPEDDELADAIPSSDVLRENSISLAGTYTPTAGSAVNFEMTYDLSEDFEISGSGFDLANLNSQSVVIAFRLAKWFDFSDADLNDKNRDFSDLAAGAIDLNKDSSATAAKELREVIKELIKNSADFGKDNDGDGRLESDEDSDEEDADELEQESE